MWTEGAAGHYRSAGGTLATIATHYVGEPVRIVWEWERHCGGSAYYDHGWVIGLNPGGRADRLGNTFFHEIGHVVLGHVQRRNLAIVSDPEAEHPLTVLRSRLEANPDDDAAAAILPYVERIEREADEWADRTLAEFEAQWGPFLDMITGKE